MNFYDRNAVLKCFFFLSLYAVHLKGVLGYEAENEWTTYR